MKIIFVPYRVALSLWTTCVIYIFILSPARIDLIEYLICTGNHNIKIRYQNQMTLVFRRSLPNNQLTRNFIVSIHLIKGSYQYSSSILSELHIDITKWHVLLSYHHILLKRINVLIRANNIIGYITSGKQANLKTTYK